MGALASFRKARAVELAVSGMSYDNIATAVGYANRGTAWRTVQRALQDRTFHAVDEYREVELARLDALQSACWDAALAGDLRAISAVLRVIEQRCRLLGLEGQKATQEGNGGLLVQPPQSPG